MTTMNRLTNECCRVFVYTRKDRRGWSTLVKQENFFIITMVFSGWWSWEHRQRSRIFAFDAYFYTFVISGLVANFID